LLQPAAADPDTTDTAGRQLSAEQLKQQVIHALSLAARPEKAPAWQEPELEPQHVTNASRGHKDGVSSSKSRLSSAMTSVRAAVSAFGGGVKPKVDDAIEIPQTEHALRSGILELRAKNMQLRASVEELHAAISAVRKELAAATELRGRLSSLDDVS